MTAFIFSGSMAILPLETICPRYSTEVVANSHFLSLQYLLMLAEFLHDLFDVVYVFVFGG